MCRMWSTVNTSPEGSSVSASVVYFEIRRLMSSGTVAEKSITCFFAGKVSRMRVTSS